jgi:hypothetical protein
VTLIVQGATPIIRDAVNTSVTSGFRNITTLIQPVIDESLQQVQQDVQAQIDQIYEDFKQSQMILLIIVVVGFFCVCVLQIYIIRRRPVIT